MPPPSVAHGRGLPLIVLGIGLIAISFSAIFARFAQAEGVASLAVATWRLGLAALIITPLAMLQSRHELVRSPAVRTRARASRDDRYATTWGSGAVVRTTDKWVEARW